MVKTKKIAEKANARKWKLLLEILLIIFLFVAPLLFFLNHISSPVEDTPTTNSFVEEKKVSIPNSDVRYDSNYTASSYTTWQIESLIEETLSLIIIFISVIMVLSVIIPFFRPLERV